MNSLPKAAPSQVPHKSKPLRGKGCRAKGARGERQWRDELRANGYQARRGQQFCGSPESPDVVCADLDWIHFEVKAVERLNLSDACEQAARDAKGKTWVVAHRRNFCPWLVTMTAETFFRLLRREFEQEFEKNSSLSSVSLLPSLHESTGSSKNYSTKNFKGPCGPEKQKENPPSPEAMEDKQQQTTEREK